jgi:hopene-associated glycosyltransferase HpnB
VTALALAVLSFAVWVYLLSRRGGFWRALPRDDATADARSSPHAWPRVVAVVPARNEAEVIGQSVGSLLRQDYPGDFRIVVVDDHSDDGTAALAREAATTAGASERLTVLPAPPLPGGWTGKLWAVHCGIAHVDATAAPPSYLLLTDADIAYAPETLTTLVRRAQRDGLVLSSLMAHLRCASPGERALIPAFVFFFRMLYPFAWVNHRSHRTAAAAGGCMLVLRDALEAAGGIAAICDALIDDCALARRLKAQGPIRLALTHRARSLRAYRTVADFRQMIGRCAYAQLKYSPWLLVGVTVAMSAVFLAPPLLALGGTGSARWLAVGAWGLMALAFQPTLRFYDVSPGWGLALPAIAAVYLGFTLDSAWAHWRGRGGMWKGRAQAPAPERR